VKNITVSVPDDVYRGARIRAAEQGASLSSLVAQYLAALSSQAVEFARLEAEQDRVRQGIKRFTAADRVSREDLHDRSVR
jgi:hypothetical protein